jgi:hypothetical protein
MIQMKLLKNKSQSDAYLAALPPGKWDSYIEKNSHGDYGYDKVFKLDGVERLRIVMPGCRTGVKVYAVN